MTEVNTETKKAATKKTATKKKSTSTAAKKTTPKAKEKKFELNTPIRCKSVRQNELYYKAPSGMKYVWNGFGDIREIPYQEIVSMKASRSSFLYAPWLIIEDEELLKKPDYAADFKDMYELYKEFDNPAEFFNQTTEEIERKLSNIPTGLKDLIIYNAGRYIEDGSLDRVSVVNTLDRMFGTNLKMLML